MRRKVATEISAVRNETGNESSDVWVMIFDLVRVRVLDYDREPENRIWRLPPLHIALSLMASPHEMEFCHG